MNLHHCKSYADKASDFELKGKKYTEPSKDWVHINDFCFHSQYMRGFSSLKYVPAHGRDWD